MYQVATRLRNSISIDGHVDRSKHKQQRGSLKRGIEVGLCTIDRCIVAGGGANGATRVRSPDDVRRAAMDAASASARRRCTEEPDALGLGCAHRLTRSAAWMPIASGTTEKKTRLVGQATQRRMRGREGGTGDVRRDTALSSTSQMLGWCDVIKIPMK